MFPVCGWCIVCICDHLSLSAGGHIVFFFCSADLYNLVMIFKFHISLLSLYSVDVVILVLMVFYCSFKVVLFQLLRFVPHCDHFIISSCLF